MFPYLQGQQISDWLKRNHRTIVIEIFHSFLFTTYSSVVEYYSIDSVGRNYSDTNISNYRPKWFSLKEKIANSHHPFARARCDQRTGITTSKDFQFDSFQRLPRRSELFHEDCPIILKNDLLLIVISVTVHLPCSMILIIERFQYDR